MSALTSSTRTRSNGVLNSAMRCTIRGHSRGMLTNRPAFCEGGWAPRKGGEGNHNTSSVYSLLLAPPPHTHTFSFTFSFNSTVHNCAVRSRACCKIRRFVQLKFLDCVTVGTAEGLTAQLDRQCVGKSVGLCS